MAASTFLLYIRCSRCKLSHRDGTPCGQRLNQKGHNLNVFLLPFSGFAIGIMYLMYDMLPCGSEFNSATSKWKYFSFPNPSRRSSGGKKLCYHFISSPCTNFHSNININLTFLANLNDLQGTGFILMLSKEL